MLDDCPQLILGAIGLVPRSQRMHNAMHYMLKIRALDARALPNDLLLRGKPSDLINLNQLLQTLHNLP